MQLKLLPVQKRSKKRGRDIVNMDTQNTGNWSLKTKGEKKHESKFINCSLLLISS